MNFFLNIANKVFFVGFLFLLPLLFTNAFEIRDTATEIKNDFVLEPAKLEIDLDPGASTVQTINILNRTDKQLEFKVEVEDFTGSQDPSQTVVLQGDEKGPYSLKDYLVPEIETFSLKPGQKMILPVVINIPLDAEPGGLYGSVLISSQVVSEGGMGATIVSRLGALFFVNISGEVTKSGELTSFSKLDSEDKIGFELLFTNKGNVHLNPYGEIKIFNIIGTQIGEVEVPAYFAMPDSVRYRKVEWETGKIFGRYKAVVSLNRGYNDLVDELTVTFWVLSVKLIATILGGLILLTFIILWLVKNFDFNITKERKDNPDQSAESEEEQKDIDYKQENK